MRDGPCGSALEHQRTWKAPPIGDQKATYYLQAPEGNFSIEEKDYLEILGSIQGSDRPEKTPYEMYKVTIENKKRVDQVTNLTEQEYLTWRKKLRGY
jgi:hypothetical protein